MSTGKRRTKSKKTRQGHLATLLLGQELKVAALLDSDEEGLKAQKQLVHNWLLADGDVLMLGAVVGTAGTYAIEDLFDSTFVIMLAADVRAQRTK